MFPLQQLQQELTHKIFSAQEICDRAEAEKRPLNIDEEATVKRLIEESNSIKDRMAAIQRHHATTGELSALKDSLDRTPGRNTQPDPVTPPPQAAAKIPATAKRTGSLKAFKGAQAEEKAYRCGMWARAVILRDERALSWCLNQGVGTDIRNALSTTSNPAGGFLVPDEFSQTIIDLREQYGVFRQNTRVVPMGRDTMTVPRRAGGVTIGPIAENPSSAISQSQPSWNQVQLTAKKAGGLTLMSTEIAEDAVIDMADWLAQEFAYAFSLYEDQCGFIGDGTATYLGIRGLGNILVAGASLAGAVDAASGHDTFAELDAIDLAGAMAKLPLYARMGAKWFCSSVCWDLVFGRLMAAAGGNTIQDVQGGYQRSYLGYPIVISQVLPTVLTDLSDVPMLYFGDLSKASTMGDRRDVRIFPSEHRYMDTDQIGIRATARFDIAVHDYGDSTTAGPIVALVGE